MKIKRKNKSALIKEANHKFEVNHVLKTKHFLTEEEIENLDEGIKDWIAKGLIAITLLGGGMKLYHMDQQAAQDKHDRTEYYEKALKDQVTKTETRDLAKLGLEINKETNKVKLAYGTSSEDADGLFKSYAESYMKQHPHEFGIGTDGTIYWLQK